MLTNVKSIHAHEIVNLTTRLVKKQKQKKKRLEILITDFFFFLILFCV